MIICAAIHGILTGQTRASWPDEFDAWCVRQHGVQVRREEIHVLKKEYSAGPFPRLNWIKNRRLAAGLVEEIFLLAEAGRNARAPIWFVAHSNGCVIALMAARMLIERGIRVDGMILTGAACESDVRRNGILRWVEFGQLGQAVALSSAEDGVVSLQGIMRWVKWPYGDLGRVGWQINGKAYASAWIRTIWIVGGHCGYFAPDRMAGTFWTFVDLMTRGGKR